MYSEDITQIKKLDELTNLMRITEDQNERLVNFSHIVSHNLRSHVANFEMILSLLEKQEEQIFTHPLIQLLSESSKKLDETIRHLNEVVQMNLNKDNQIVEMDLSFAVLSATRITSTLAKENNVEIINDVQNSVMIKAIPAYVDSIILNMLTNAIRYKSDKSPAFVKLSTIITSNYTQLLVEDNGLGIDLTKYGNKLFGLYKTFHEHKESRGVGLFISKNQALSMKGEIKVESQPGIGSKFIISFLNA
jgi:light-regulated signal transduction histidine kinase (bacteriophytochrome)